MMIFYLCDGKRCETCYPYCTHTSDERHARPSDSREFENIQGDLWEVVKDDVRGVQTLQPEI